MKCPYCNSNRCKGCFGSQFAAVNNAVVAISFVATILGIAVATISSM